MIYNTSKVNIFHKNIWDQFRPRLKAKNAGRKTGDRRDHMPIIVNLDVMMARRKIGLTELSQRVGITLANLSILKNNKARAVRFSTLETICRELKCQPGDILQYVEDKSEIWD